MRFDHSRIPLIVFQASDAKFCVPLAAPQSLEHISDSLFNRWKLTSIFCLLIPYYVFLIFECYTFVSKLLNPLAHYLDFFLCEAECFTCAGNFYRFARSFIYSSHIQDTVGINVKSNFDQCSAFGCWLDSFKCNGSKEAIVLCLFSFALKDLQCHTCLVVNACWECLRTFGWHCRIS